jgi:hypothetical protein
MILSTTCNRPYSGGLVPPAKQLAEIEHTQLCWYGDNRLIQPAKPKSATSYNCPGYTSCIAAYTCVIWESNPGLLLSSCMAHGRRQCYRYTNDAVAVYRWNLQ